MREIDTCTYQHKGFRISYDGGTGYWTATDPEGEFMTTIADLKEAMSYIETAAEDDYSQWNEEAEIIRRMENPEISGR